MKDTTKSALSGALGTLIATGIFIFLAKGADIWTHVDVENTPISEIKKNHENLNKDVETKHNDLLLKINNNIEINKEYGKQISTAVEELRKVKHSLLTKPVRGSVTREIGESGSGKNVIWVNRYSDARDFEIQEKVKITSPTAVIEASVAGYILDERENIIFKANTDVAEQIGLTERLWTSG